MKNFKDISMPIGLRNIKTTIAVLICLVLYALINRENVIFACIASIICMKDTIERSISFGKRRLVGTFIGGVFGTAFLLIGEYIKNYYLFLLFVSIGITILIFFCNLIKLQHSIPIACVVYLIILLTQKHTPGLTLIYEDSLTYAINRIIDTGVGVIIAVIVNFSIRTSYKDFLSELKFSNIFKNDLTENEDNVENIMPCQKEETKTDNIEDKDNNK